MGMRLYCSTVALAGLCLLHSSTVAAGATNITKAFIVFSNHLDIGYTDNKVSQFPKAHTHQ